MSINRNMSILAAGASSTGNLLTYTGANKIINGDMRIDQRNAGAAVTATAALIYGGDRWFTNASVTGKFSVQSQVASPSPVVGVPATCVKILSLAATTPGAADYYEFGQRIEGLNCIDLQWGTAVAAAVTMSFWVYSSLTGTFGGTIANSAGNRSYPFNYTVGSANTWTKISVAITGDTTGTWLTTNGTFMQVILNMGAGSTYGTGTASTWAGSLILQPTGSTNFVATNAAAMYVSAIKLEVGSIVTPFVPDDYSVSLRKCQRYCCIFTGNIYQPFAAAYVDTSGNAQCTIYLPVSMRTAPSFSSSGTFGHYLDGYNTLTGTLSLNIAHLQDVSLSIACGYSSGYYKIPGQAWYFTTPSSIKLDAEL